MNSNGDDSDKETLNRGPANWGVTIHGVMPPPVTGMTLCTKSVLDAISQRRTVHTFNWSNGASSITAWFRTVKAVRALFSAFTLLISRCPKNSVFYMPVNSGMALHLNILAAMAARLRGYRCAFHHHIYKYLDRRDWRVKTIDRLLGPRGLHIVLCPHMESSLRRLYECQTPVAIVPSTIQLLQAEWIPPPINESEQVSLNPFYLGHISNLQVAKGLDSVIEVLRALRERGHDARLILAGPTHSQLERNMIEQAAKEFGAMIDYRGPVYGAEKERFFNDIHVKLFPTRYPDAQPLVITESFAFSRPAISYGRGCIPGMMGPAKDWSIATDADFVSAAAGQIERWISAPTEYTSARRLARRRFDTMLEEAAESLDNFIHWIFREPDNGFVHFGGASDTEAR
jgi:glycosyltransferase involved in cell wall biosynthesis